MANRLREVHDGNIDDGMPEWWKYCSDDEIEAFYNIPVIVKGNVDFNTAEEAFESYQKSILKDLEELAKIVPPDIVKE